MKFNILAILLVLTKRANAQCTLPTSVNAASCSYEGLIEALDAELDAAGCTDTATDLIQKKFGLSLEEAQAKVAEVCAIEHIPFGAITGEGYVFDKGYFDGGTYYNGQRESINEHGVTINKLSTDPGERINDIYRNLAQSNGFTWPDNLQNFDSCELNAAMCCWVQDRQARDGNGNCRQPYDDEDGCVDADPADNVDVCYVDMSRAPTSSRTTAGIAIFEGEDEGDSHCHGFAWAEDPSHESARFKANNLFYVSLYDHLQQRGYVKNVPGAPMCACVEQMAVVDRSDCTEIDVSETVEFSLSDTDGLTATITDLAISFNACQGANNNNNDLAAYVERLTDEGKISEEKKEAFDEIVVGEYYCREAIDSFLDEEGLAPKPACKYADPLECGCKAALQKDYKGYINVTKSGLTCQNWDAQEPHRHGNTRERNPDSYLSENYCRNPDNEPGGAWCYTTDPNTRWEYCDVPVCEEVLEDLLTVETDEVDDPDCTYDDTDPLQKEYRGDLAETASGLTCQRWDTQNPHVHTRTVVNYPDSGLEENYCRNPDNEPEGAWCYTTDPNTRWAYCDVPRCKGTARKARQLRGEQKNGKK